MTADVNVPDLTIVTGASDGLGARTVLDRLRTARQGRIRGSLTP